MTLSLSNLLIVALAGVCAWLASKWGFKKDTEAENRRREAGRIAATLTSMGFTELPEFFIDYSVGDRSGMAFKLSAVAKKLAGGEKAILAELEGAFTKLLDIKLNTPEGRIIVSSKLAEIEKQLAVSAEADPAV
jgi:hypothetical protein